MLVLLCCNLQAVSLDHSLCCHQTYHQCNTLHMYQRIDIAAALQSATGNSMMIDGGDAGGAAAINLMDEDRVGMFGGRSKRRR